MTRAESVWACGPGLSQPSLQCPTARISSSYSAHSVHTNAECSRRGEAGGTVRSPEVVSVVELQELSDPAPSFIVINFAPEQSHPQRPVIDKAYFYVVSALAAVFAVATITLLIVVFTTGHGNPEESRGSTSAQAVSKKCGGERYLTLGADKKSLTYEDSSSSGEGGSVLQCILRETGAPSSVISRISHTRGLDGNQSASWHGWSIYWSYMKGEGLDVTLAEE